MLQIPKIIHFFWDKTPLSYLQYLTIVSFNKFNPEWRIILHQTNKAYGSVTWVTPENRIKHSGKDYYNNLINLDYVELNDIDFNELGFTENLPDVYKSDYLRWYLLSTIGGVWSDMDILFIKPLSDLDLPEDTETVVCYGPEKHIIGFLMSKPYNDFFKVVLDDVNNVFNSNDYQCIGSKLLNKHQDNVLYRKDVYNLDKTAFYSYDHHVINKIFNESDLSLITDKTIGIHWYNGSPISKNFTNIFDEDNTNFNNLITTLIIKHSIKNENNRIYTN